MIISGKVCAVTGAGRGLGFRIAAELAEAGARVCGGDIDLGQAPACAELARKQGWDLRLESCDVTEEGSVERFFAEIAQREGRLDVLVNNAGITRDGLLVKYKDGELSRLPLSDFQSVIDVNLKGVFLCAREAAAIMARQGGGIIVNISSISRAGNFGQTAYSASKAGVDAMTVTWAKELARHRIRVAAVAPGYLNTEMVAAIRPDALEKILGQVPLKRLGEVAEIARTVRFIIENDFVNSRVLDVDGGLRI